MIRKKLPSHKFDWSKLTGKFGAVDDRGIYKDSIISNCTTQIRCESLHTGDLRK